MLKIELPLTFNKCHIINYLLKLEHLLLMYVAHNKENLFKNLWP